MASIATEVDVLIVGAGPAGLMLATWLSKLKVQTKIIDKRNTKIFTGQADGVQCRTVEVFQSFGFAERLVLEGAHINEVVFYNPGEDGGIVRTKRTPDNEPGTSRFPHAVLTQARIEQFMLDAINEFDNLTVERSITPTSLSVDSSLISSFAPTSYPVTVTLRHLSEDESTPAQTGAVPNGLFRSNILSDEEAEAIAAGKVDSEKAGEAETVRAKFVVGCDGARSWVRKQLGLTLEGDSANSVWGVLDAVVVTDFPDIRLKCTIHSKDAGSILVVPRERDLVRFYIQMGTAKPGERFDRAAVTPESIIATAQRIFAPYVIDFKHVDWYTLYEVGQRLCPKMTLDERVFLAGDASHCHSPKAGQGMNVSMMDTYNLGWKLAHVLQGKASPEILKTYQCCDAAHSGRLKPIEFLERHQTAKELIDLDYQLSRMFAAKPQRDETDTVRFCSLQRLDPPAPHYLRCVYFQEGVSLAAFKEFFIKAGRWASGTAVHYKPSLLIAPEREGGSLAPGLPHGMRFESHPVVCIADARPWHLADRFMSDGRYRLVIFAGDVREASQREKLENVRHISSSRLPKETAAYIPSSSQVAAYLDSPAGALRTYTPSSSDLDSVIEVLTIISNPRTSIEPNAFPDVLWPPKKPYGSRAYDKLYADDSSPVTPEVQGRIYEKLGVDKQKGCVVVVRPDQTVALVAGLEDPEQIGTLHCRSSRAGQQL
ncbi:SPOSA6832_01209 [Sporobolomyces salmonicolor]|uniref:SPOSA6832_01209-mRNA-1:cds n=1 Tax=Sporidiobolus salmonicolor TaxID=5005 RepID=A0A0D6EIX7_SPOSA|nr:SPOSA6832_01209 [Sporobolomyces salmonicolor]